jgi:hypothetical protein
MKSLMLITAFYKQERVHKEFVPEGKTVNSELIIRTDTGKRLMERILREKAVGPF